MDQINLNGIEYIRKDFVIDDETKKMILDIYAIIWCEAYYDACFVKNLKLRD